MPMHITNKFQDHTPVVISTVVATVDTRSQCDLLRVSIVSFVHLGKREFRRPVCAD